MAPFDPYNYTIAITPVFVIVIILGIVVGVTTGFNPFIDLFILFFASFLVYMIIKNVVLVELKLRKLRKQQRSQTRDNEYRQNDIGEDTYDLYSYELSDFDNMILSGVWLVFEIVLGMIYGFPMYIYFLIALTVVAFVYSLVKYLRHFLNKKHRSKRGS